MPEEGAVILPIPDQPAEPPFALSGHQVEKRALVQATDRFSSLFCDLTGADRVEFVFHDAGEGPAREGWFTIPMSLPEGCAGTAYLWRDHPPFRAEELDRIRILIPLAAGALKILDGCAASVAGRTRLQIASNLHDGPAQQVAHAQMNLHLLRRSQHDPRLRDGLRRLQGLLDGASRSMRDMIEDLRTPQRRVFDLGSALETMAAQLRAAGLPVDLDLDGAAQLSSPTAEVLAHIGAEAMINALKHADAQRISVRLRASEALAVLEVADDGRGLAENGTRGRRRRSFGLSLMEAQVQGLGGIFEIQSPDEGGTIVRAAVPLR